MVRFAFLFSFLTIVSVGGGVAADDGATVRAGSASRFDGFGGFDGHPEAPSTVEVVDRALRAFRGFSDQDKRDAVRQLLETGASSTPLLVAALDHLGDEPATWVARTFRQSRDPRAAYPLMKRYTRGSDTLRSEVLVALGAIGSENTIPFLATALADPQQAIRRAAATSLGRIPSRRSMRALLGALADPDDWVRSEAVAGIRRMSEGSEALDPVGALVALVPRLPRHGVADALALLAGTRDRKAYELLVEQARLGDDRARRVAVRGLGLQGRVSARSVLESSLDDSDVDVRVEAIRALRVLFGCASARVLVDRLGREDSPRVRRELRQTLRGCAGRDFGDSVEPWRAWLQSDS